MHHAGETHNVMAIELKSTNGAASPTLDLTRAIADRKERPTPWVDSDSFPWHDEEFSARFVRRANYQELYGMKETGEEVEDLAALLNRGAKARVLDLCSGNGRHAIAMALRGYRVTGIDVGPGAVSLARETAKNLGLTVDFRLLDVKSISFEDAYDAAYLTCGGLSQFSPNDASQVLAIAERALAPGGTLVVEYAEKNSVPTADVRSWQFVQAEKSLFSDGPHLQLEERLYDPESSADTSRFFVVPSDGHVREFAQCRQYYTEDGVRQLMKAVGLEALSVSAGSAPSLKKMAAKKS
jgi:ubiquinone/menaquinone biosynthesis C-methylase UbiE